MNQNERFTRRQFLFAVPSIAATLALSSCADAKENGIDTLNHVLRRELGITASTTRDQLAKIAFDRMQDANWNTNRTFGKIENLRGETVRLATDSRGEPDWSLVHTIYEKVRYLEPPTIRTHTFRFEDDSEGIRRELRLEVYGMHGTIEAAKRYDEIKVRNFLHDYFSEKRSIGNVLHLNYIPYMMRVDFATDGIQGLQEALIPSDGKIRAARTTSIAVHLEDGTRVYRTDVLLNIHATHDDAEHLGIMPEQILRLNIANELTGVLGAQYSDESIPERIRINEAYSTLAGYLAAFDDFAPDVLFGGQAYKEFLPYIELEMIKQMELGKIK
jgi:hypothetical protein